MNIVIIEDEKLAAEHLQRLIKKVVPTANIVTTIDSVVKSIEWFTANGSYDLVFMDIHLADGLSFEIFENVKITAPIVFTTAYDEYAIKAFKVNSIDYLLKPFDLDDITSAFTKYNSIRQPQASAALGTDVIDKVRQMLGHNYKARFVIKVGEHIRFVSTEEILYFYSLEKSTFLQSNTGKTYPIDYALDELESMVDPAMFFRINRKYIVNLSSLADIISFTNSRLKLKLKQCNDDDVIVSREKVQDFKKWLEG